jgi:hypothetical protein
MRRFAKGRRHVTGRMNGLEADFEATFLIGKPHGFEQLKFRLADGTYLTPDFWVLDDNDVLTIEEVKGHWEDDARVKIKVAAEMYPHFRWRAWRRQPKKLGGGWVRESFGPEDAA